LTAALTLGVVTRDEVPDLVRVERTFVPGPAASTAYEAIYREFRGLYGQQKAMFARLNG